MNKDELKEALKEILKEDLCVEFYETKKGNTTYLHLDISLDGEVISENQV